MDKNEYLNEEKYQKNVKKIRKIALTILLVGLIIGGSVIGLGINKRIKIDEKYSDEKKAEVQEKIDKEKKSLESKKDELQEKIVEIEKNKTNELSSEKKKIEDEKARLEAKGIKFNKFAKYEDGDEYTLLVATETLDPSFGYCSFDQSKNHNLTKRYCELKNNDDEYSKNINLINEDIKLINDVLNSNNCIYDSAKNNDMVKSYCLYKNELGELNSEFDKEFEKGESVPFFMYGGFIIVITCMFAGSIYMSSKGRDIAAFNAQQMNPIAKEQMESMGSSLGKAMANAAKEINPEYKSFTCPNCGANLSGTSDVEVCNFCGTKLTKVGKID